LVNVATNYSDEQILLATVDASKNSELKKYLLGGYPTVRVFSKGKVGDKSFLGNKPEHFVKDFIDSIVE